MIRGKYMTSMDDLSQVLDIRRNVFQEEQNLSIGARDALDDMAVYALVFDEDGVPTGTGRLYLFDDRFFIGRVCVLKSARGQKLGDLVLRMLLYRAQELNAPEVYVHAQIAAVPFYARYGFKPLGEIELDGDVPCRLMRATAEEIDIEGSCKTQESACGSCDKPCEGCDSV